MAGSVRDLQRSCPIRGKHTANRPPVLCQTPSELWHRQLRATARSSPRGVESLLLAFVLAGLITRRNDASDPKPCLPRSVNTERKIVSPICERTASPRTTTTPTTPPGVPTGCNLRGRGDETLSTTRDVAYSLWPRLVCNPATVSKSPNLRLHFKTCSDLDCVQVPETLVNSSWIDLFGFT